MVPCGRGGAQECLKLKTVRICLIPFPVGSRVEQESSLYGTRGFLPLLDFLSLPPFPCLIKCQLQSEKLFNHLEKVYLMHYPYRQNTCAL